VTNREKIIQGLIKGGMSREEASVLVRELCREYEVIGRRDGYDTGYDDGIASQM
jgi:hypothetical protein